MFTYCNNNPGNHVDNEGNQPIRNTMLMTNDGGKNTYYRTYAELKGAEGIPTDRLEYQWTIDSNVEIIGFAASSVGVMVYDAYSTVVSIVETVAAVGTAGASAGASLLAAGKFLYKTVDGVVSVVADLAATITAVCRYCGNGEISVTYTIPIDIEVGFENIFEGMMSIDY